MTESLTDPELTLLFLVFVACLTAAFVWALSEIEQQKVRRAAPQIKLIVTTPTPMTSSILLLALVLLP
jgi:hypothetical protein